MSPTAPPPLPALQAAPDREAVARTADALRPYVRHTPVLSSGSLDAEDGMRLLFKAENLQRVGAFKMRGAMRAALALTAERRTRGLATHSSGNHAQAVAKAARLLGCPAYVVMPEDAPAVKRMAVIGYGARVIPCAPTIQDREATLDRVVAETGAAFIPPFDHYDVIAGQATVGWEFLREHPDLDALVVPVGGGGLAAGTCLSAGFLAPGLPVYAAEPERVDDAFRTLRSGERQTNERTDTVADGLKTPLGERNWTILRERLTDVLTVPEADILPATRRLVERLNVMVEPSAAVAYAAVRTRTALFRGKRVGIVLSGGNADPAVVWG